MTGPSWETWLEGQFPAYLLRCAEGHPRPTIAVARALARLAGDPDSLHQLAALAFLLDPRSEVERLVCDDLPAYLRRIHPRTERLREELHGHVRGRIDWGRTLVLRQQTRDPARAIATSLRRTFEIPELLLLRWLVERIRLAAATLGPSAYARDDLWVARLSRIHNAAEAALRHAALRDLPDVRLAADTLRVCQASRDDAIKRAARVVHHHSNLLPRPGLDFLRDALARYSLVPHQPETRFELYILLTLIDAIDRAWPAATRKNTLISARRRAIATWREGQAILRLIYNQPAESGAYTDALRHAYDARANLRPDLRLVFEDPARKVELLLDAKLSSDLGYLRAAYLKMHGYLADRPRAFRNDITPKAIVLAERPLVRPPRPTDSVVYLDPASCREAGALDTLVTHWLAQLLRLAAHPQPEREA